MVPFSSKGGVVNLVVGSSVNGVDSNFLSLIIGVRRIFLSRAYAYCLLPSLSLGFPLGDILSYFFFLSSYLNFIFEFLDLFQMSLANQHLKEIVDGLPLKELFKMFEGAHRRLQLVGDQNLRPFESYIVARCYQIVSPGISLFSISLIPSVLPSKNA